MPDLTDLLRNTDGPVRLKARWVLPISGPLFENGEVAFENGKLTYVGRARPDEGALDLGLAAILPGFVNVHAHLEYTVLRGLLEDMPFFPWIRGLTALKQFLTLDDWVTSATLGAAEMAAAGITTIGDACDAGASVSALASSGLRGTVFREVFGIENTPPISQTLDLLKRQLAQMGSTLTRSSAESRVHLGISPHAPYTVRAELFSTLASFADQNGYLQTIHLAESPAEEALFQIGGGPFKEMFERRGITWETKNISPIAYAKQSGALDALCPCQRGRYHAARQCRSFGGALPSLQRKARSRARTATAAQSPGSGYWPRHRLNGLGQLGRLFRGDACRRLRSTCP